MNNVFTATGVLYFKCTFTIFLQMRNKEVEVLKEFNRRTGFNSVPVTPEKVELFRFVMNITNRKNQACTTDETKLSLSPSVKQHRRPICVPGFEFAP